MMHSSQTALPQPIERRQDPRTPDYRALEWRPAGTMSLKSGWVVQHSPHAVAMLTEGPETPAIGTRLEFSRRWNHVALPPVTVERVERLSDALDLVVAAAAP